MRRKKCPCCKADGIEWYDLLLHFLPVIRRRVRCKECGRCLVSNPGDIIYISVSILLHLPAFVFLILSFIAIFITGSEWLFNFVVAVFLYFSSVFVLSFTLVDLEGRL